MATRVTHIHTKLWTDQYDLWRGQPIFTDFTSLFCRLRREEAPGDPRFSLQHEVAGPRPGRVHIMSAPASARRARRPSSAATRGRPRFRVKFHGHPRRVRGVSFLLPLTRGTLVLYGASSSCSGAASASGCDSSPAAPPSPRWRPAAPRPPPALSAGFLQSGHRHECLVTAPGTLARRPAHAHAAHHTHGHPAALLHVQRARCRPTTHLPTLRRFSFRSRPSGRRCRWLACPSEPPSIASAPRPSRSDALHTFHTWRLFVRIYHACS